VTVSFVICLYVLEHLSLNGYSCNLIGVLYENVKKLQICLKLEGRGERKNNGHFTQRLVFIIDSNKSSAAIHRTQCCASILMLSTFITLMTAIYIHIHYIHQYKREVFLLDHINNGYTNASQNYFLYTFPISLP